MFYPRFVAYILFFAVIFGLAGVKAESGDRHYASAGSRVVEDVIDIHVADGEVLGIRNGVSVHKKKLGLREEILWKGTRGHVGTVLTDQRLLVLSKNSPGWKERSWRLDEVSSQHKPDVAISDFLVLAVTGRRIIIYDGLVDKWTSTNVSLHDRIEDFVVDNYVAAIVTEKRVLGVAGRRGRFVPENFQSNESVVSVSARPHSITIRTSQRLLIFRSRSPFWDVTRLN